MAELRLLVVVLGLGALAACRPDPPAEVAPCAEPALAPSCIDLHFQRRDQALRTTGLAGIGNQPGPALAPPARRPPDVVVLTAGRRTRLALRADPADRLVGLRAEATIGGDVRRTLANLGIATATADGSRLVVEPRAEAMGAALVLHDSQDGGVMVAFGAAGVAHLVRARRHVAGLPPPAPALDGSARQRMVEAVVAHDVDRDGVRELVVQVRVTGPVDDGELHVVDADGRARVLLEPLLDGAFAGWDGLPLGDGRTLWTSVVSNGGDDIMGRWTLLDRDGFAAIQWVRGSPDDAVCLDGLPAAPSLRIAPRP